MKENVILLGMPASGKSSIGKALAEATGRPFIDTDVLIEQKLGRRISELFRLYGEEAFRDHETAVLRDLSVENAVIATGGGIVGRPQNWVEMRRLGVTVFLDVEFDRLAERLEAGRKKRPMLAHSEWRERLGELLEERRPLYEQAEVVAVLDDLDVASCAEMVLREVEKALNRRFK